MLRRVREHGDETGIVRRLPSEVDTFLRVGKEDRYSGPWGLFRKVEGTTPSTLRDGLCAGGDLTRGRSLTSWFAWATAFYDLFGVYFFRMRPRDAVWTVPHDRLALPFDRLSYAQSRSRDWKDAVGRNAAFSHRSSEPEHA